MAFAEFNKNRTAASALAVISLWLTALVAVVAQDSEFDWSWKQDAADAEPEKDPDPPAEKGFDWSWDGGDEPAGLPVDSPGKVKPPAKIRDDDAYQKLLKENLDLRRKIAEAMKDEEVARNESNRMAREIKDMEQNLAASVQMIKQLKESQNSSMNPEEVNELEVKLANAEKARQMLTAELDRLKRTLDEDARKSSTAKVGKDSDLFREKEQENSMLKKRLVEIETERRKLAREREKLASEAETAQEELKEIREKAVAAAKQGAEYKKIVEKLPDIEEQVNLLRTDVKAKDRKLSAREQQLEALKVELERREHRLAKAQKMADLLEKARSEVQQVNNREKLDLHYNMAGIYYKEGRVRDAEAEYLKALRIDPSDADIHYNLGILYDQDLNKPGKAAMHYRRYLTLRPNASDSDQVKNWIMDLDMAR